MFPVGRTGDKATGREEVSVYNDHRRSAAVLQVMFLITATIAFLQPRSRQVEAASNLTNKGFVTARAEGSISILDAGTTFKVAVNKNTQVVGRRSAFQEIAINDLVRIEAAPTPDSGVVAARIEVLLAAGSLSAGPGPRPGGTTNWVLGVIMNGGIVVPLP